MREEERLEFGGWNLETVVLDELLEAIDDEQVPVRVDVADIAGAKPAIGIDRALGGLGVVQVADHHLWATNEQFTAFAHAEVGSGLWVDDSALRIRGGDAT